MIKSCLVLYNPGVGGNFIKFCLSLSKETVPYYHTDLATLSDDEISKVQLLTARDRAEICKFSTIEDFVKIHSPVIVDPTIHYKNLLINDHYTWAISHSHPTTYKSLSIFPWTTQIFYLDIDIEKYSNWLINATTAFKPHHQWHKRKWYDDQKNSETQTLIAEVKNMDITTNISMTSILDSVEGFVAEYQKMCNTLSITPEIDVAVPYYQAWKKLRVDPYI